MTPTPAYFQNGPFHYPPSTISVDTDYRGHGIEIIVHDYPRQLFDLLPYPPRLINGDPPFEVKDFTNPQNITVKFFCKEFSIIQFPVSAITHSPDLESPPPDLKSHMVVTA